MAGLEGIQQINSRARQLYDIVNSSSSLLADKDTLVLVLGAGFGDLDMIISAKNGCKVVGFEKDEAVFASLSSRIDQSGLPVAKLNADIERVSLREYVRMASVVIGKPVTNPIKVVAICFSVLPYLRSPDMFLTKIASFDEVYIECQYDGDGPGFGFIKNDDDMSEWLRKYFSSVSRVGSTTVKEGAFDRTVWRCTNVR